MSVVPAPGFLRKSLAYARHLLGQRDQLLHLFSQHVLRPGKQRFPAGHYYSPIPSLKELRRKEHRVFAPPARELPGIDLNVERQLELLEELANYYPTQPFQAYPSKGRRYHFENPSFSYGDALTLHGLMRHLRPRRIIEVGSGYSSCVILDTNELYFEGKIECTFIDPYPRLLRSLLKRGDADRCPVIARNLQDVDLAAFAPLEAGDILFIDSSHVAKVNSDVNYVFAHILPSLARGVVVHFHDIFYPFEYPKVWVYRGIAWNEAYVLRAFLQYNSAFEILLFNSFLWQFHEHRVVWAMPLCANNPGASLWLRKVGTWQQTGAATAEFALSQAA